MPQWACVPQRTTRGSQLSLPTTRAPGVRMRLSGPTSSRQPLPSGLVFGKVLYPHTTMLNLDLGGSSGRQQWPLVKGAKRRKSSSLLLWGGLHGGKSHLSRERGCSDCFFFFKENVDMVIKVPPRLSCHASQEEHRVTRARHS